MKHFEAIRKFLVYRKHSSSTKVRLGKNSANMFFEWETEEGKKEIDLILEKVSIYEQALFKLSDGRIKPRPLNKMFFGAMSFADKGLIFRVNKQSRAYYQEVMNEYTSKYPFFMNLSKRNPSFEDIISAIDKTIDKNRIVIDDIKSLKGEARIELLGFMKAVSLTMSQYTDEVADEINTAFDFVQSQKTIMARIKEIVTNSQTRWMLACYTLANFGTALNQIRVLKLLRMAYVQIGVMAIGIACGVYGGATAISGVVRLTTELLKHTRYTRTGHYDEETYNKYLVSYAVSLTLAYIWLRPSLPRLGKRSVAVWRKYKASKRLKRMRARMRKKMKEDSKGASGLAADVSSDVSEQWVTRSANSLIRDESQLLKSYMGYYAKDISLRSIALRRLVLEHTKDSFRSLIPVALERSWNSELQVFSFGEIISLSQNLGIKDLMVEN